MNMKEGKKMKLGLMCHSPSSTAVCISHDYRSVIQPGRRPYTNTTLLDHLHLLNINTNYIPLHSHQHRKLPQRPAISHDDLFQVVVMRVSIHCQGCAAKLKKHLSKMEGVTSFSIDLESKRVTVMGHVSPSDVLESISKVKKAELWSS